MAARPRQVSVLVDVFCNSCALCVSVDYQRCDQFNCQKVRLEQFSVCTAPNCLRDRPGARAAREGEGRRRGGGRRRRVQPRGRGRLGGGRGLAPLGGKASLGPLGGGSGLRVLDAPMQRHGRLGKL